MWTETRKKKQRLNNRIAFPIIYVYVSSEQRSNQEHVNIHTDVETIINPLSFIA